MEKNWNFPKMANMRKYAHTIRELVMVSFTDTGPRESFNKDLRAAYNSTNRKLNGLTQQVANKVQQVEALQKAATADTNGEGAKKPVGAVSVERCCAVLQLSGDACFQIIAVPVVRPTATAHTS
ncbi:hypothetical protein COO60DRAFT_1272928 [Scenedesmus sp. NREL 46B-D3]|nr:hypothetical protein COO60DRAFT_1272928 [Scenedesmus sp. NREL 46B-D3]